MQHMILALLRSRRGRGNCDWPARHCSTLAQHQLGKERRRKIEASLMQQPPLDHLGVDNPAHKYLNMLTMSCEISILDRYCQYNVARSAISIPVSSACSAFPQTPISAAQ